MTAPTISISESAPFAAVRAFLLSILPAGAEVIQAQDNGSPMPPGGFVAMNATRLNRLGSNVDSYLPDASQKTIQTASQYTMQLDFYGPSSGEWAMIAQTLFRDQSAADAFPPNIRPLYADDPVQLPLINGEQQFEERWKLEAVLQVNPVVTIDQGYADHINIGVRSVDVFYPA